MFQINIFKVNQMIKTIKMNRAHNKTSFKTIKHSHNKNKLKLIFKKSK